MTIATSTAAIMTYGIHLCLEAGLVGRAIKGRSVAGGRAEVIGFVVTGGSLSGFQDAKQIELSNASADHHEGER
jgi:hypothetical protein